MLLKMVPGAIRRFHATPAKNLNSIRESGLLPHNPGGRGGTGVYTSVYPDYFHEMPGSGLVVIDIPKTEYQALKRLPHNPETPVYRRGMGTTQRLKDNSGTDYCERFIVDTIQDKGRVDIFSDRLRPEWFTDMVYVGPDNNIYRLGTRAPDMPKDISDTWDRLDSDELTKIIDKFNASNTDELIGESFFKEK